MEWTLRAEVLDTARHRLLMVAGAGAAALRLDSEALVPLRPAPSRSSLPAAPLLSILIRLETSLEL